MLILREIFNKESAELVGIMLGDGGMRSSKKGYYVAAFGNSETEKEYMLKFVSKLFERIFYEKPSVHYNSFSKEIRLQLTNKLVLIKAKKLGLILGNKHKNNVGIPLWIFSNKEFIKACIRGLIDTDGCVYSKWSYPRIPQIEFYSSIPRLQKDFSKAIMLLGIRISKWRKRKKASSVCGIYGKEEVFKYYKEIGFNNLKNLKRFKEISCLGSIDSSTGTMVSK
jgi:intein/homing endonuclease